MIVSSLIFLFVGVTAYIANAHASLHNSSLVPMNVTPGGTRSKEDNPVYDVILIAINWFLEKIKWDPGQTYALVFTNFSVIVLLIRLVTLGRDSFWIIRRTFTVLSVVYGIRSLMVSITVIPTPMPICYYVIKESLIETAIYNFLHGNESCGDVFFSGHTILFTTTIYTWLSRPPTFYPPIAHAIVLIIAVLGYSSLLISKLHYTIDVLGGLWFTLSVILAYNWLTSSSDLREKWYSRAFRMWDYPPPGKLMDPPGAITIASTAKRILTVTEEVPP